MSEHVLDQLLSFIAAGDSPTQRLLPEHALCDRLGVSRSALREALSGLGHLGIVETHGKVRVGSTVAARAHIIRRLAAAGSPPEQVRHSLEARNLLEPPMARLAAQRATPHAIALIEEFLELMEGQSAGGEALIIEYDSGFHVSIARASGNSTLVHIVSAIADALSSTRALSLHAPGGVARSIAGHHAIVAGIRDRDGDRAHAAMQQHLEDVAELIQTGSPQADEPPS